LSEVLFIGSCGIEKTEYKISDSPVEVILVISYAIFLMGDGFHPRVPGVAILINIRSVPKRGVRLLRENGFRRTADFRETRRGNAFVLFLTR
jgi:hypothetical protein